MNYGFNRQKTLDQYIVDFYCKPLNLVIEVDGGYHNIPLQMIKDKERQQILEGMGLNFLRFSDEQVRNNMASVIKEIENYIHDYEIKFPELKLAANRYDKAANHKHILTTSQNNNSKKA